MNREQKPSETRPAGTAICSDCTHLWPVLQTAARCEEPRRAGLKSPWLALAQIKQQQHCPAFRPKR